MILENPRKPVGHVCDVTKHVSHVADVTYLRQNKEELCSEK